MALCTASLLGVTLASRPIVPPSPAKALNLGIVSVHDDCDTTLIYRYTLKALHFSKYKFGDSKFSTWGCFILEHGYEMSPSLKHCFYGKIIFDLHHFNLQGFPSIASSSGHPACLWMIIPMSACLPSHCSLQSSFMRHSASKISSSGYTGWPQCKLNMECTQVMQIEFHICLY